MSSESFNYETNFENVCDSFDNKLSRAEVIEKDHVAFNENIDTKDKHLSIYY